MRANLSDYPRAPSPDAVTIIPTHAQINMIRHGLCFQAPNDMLPF